MEVEVHNAYVHDAPTHPRGGGGPTVESNPLTEGHTNDWASKLEQFGTVEANAIFEIYLWGCFDM
jgi:hypothetical protein